MIWSGLLERLLIYLCLMEVLHLPRPREWSSWPASAQRWQIHTLLQNRTYTGPHRQIQGCFMMDKSWKPFFGNMLQISMIQILRPEQAVVFVEWMKSSYSSSLSWLNHEQPVNSAGSRIAVFVQADIFTKKVQDNDASSKYSSCLSLCKE